jgi:hypothetical protein
MGAILGTVSIPWFVPTSTPEMGKDLFRRRQKNDAMRRARMHHDGRWMACIGLSRNAKTPPPHRGPTIRPPRYRARELQRRVANLLWVILGKERVVGGGGWGETTGVGWSQLDPKEGARASSCSARGSAGCLRVARPRGYPPDRRHEALTDTEHGTRGGKGGGARRGADQRFSALPQQGALSTLFLCLNAPDRSRCARVQT